MSAFKKKVTASALLLAMPSACPVRPWHELLESRCYGSSLCVPVLVTKVVHASANLYY